MDFSTLQATVTGQYDAQAQLFAFLPAPYDSPALTDLLTAVVHQTAWTLTAAQPPVADAQAGTVTVSGVAADFNERTAVGLTMVFFLDQAGAAQLLLKEYLELGWNFTTAWPELQGTVFDEVGIEEGNVPLYAFASVDCVDTTLENGSFVKGQNFYGRVVPASLSPTLGNLMRVLGQFVNTTAVGPLTLFEGVPTMRLTLGFQKTLESYIPLLQNHVEIQLVCRLDEVYNEVGLLLGTRFDFGLNKGLELYTLLTPAPQGILSLTGRFTGIALPSPTDFAQEFQRLIGANDLYESLPDTYQQSSNLELKTLSVGIGISSLQPVLVALEIGMPKDAPGWDLGDLATVHGVTVTARVQNPFDSTSRLIALAVGGQLELPTAGAPIDMNVRAAATFAAQRPAMYQVQAGLAPNTPLTLPVGELVNKYLPTAVNLPDITLNQLGVDFRFQQPKNHYAFYAGLDPAHPLVFEFGGQSVFEVLYANLHIENDSGPDGGAGGGLIGGMKLFGIQTDFQYQTPGNFKVTALIPEFEVSVKQIAEGLLPASWELPDWLPVIDFPQTSLYVERQGSGSAANYTFAVLAQPSFGNIVLEVAKQSNSADWAFAAGLQLHAPKIAAFESLSMLSGMDTMFRVNDLVFVFTSADMQQHFQFPATNSFRGGAGQTSIKVPAWAGPVKAGFYFYGSMSLDIEQRPNLALVPQLLGLSVELDFDLTVFIGLDPTKNAFAQARIAGNINKTTTLAGVIGARMEAGEPQFYLEGLISTLVTDGNGSTTELTSCTAANKNDCLTAGVGFVLTPNAAFLSASMLGSITFGPVTLSNMVVVVGIDFEGIPSLGFAAQIDLSAYGTTYDSSIAFFFDSGDPAKSLFAGSISDVTLKQIADTVVGVITEGEDKPPVWLDELLAEVGVSGTDTFYLPATAAAALNAKDFKGINDAFNAATKSTKYDFSLLSSLLVVGETALHEPGVWFITDFPSSNVITHYELHTEHDGRIRVALEPQFYYCMPPGGGSVVLGPPSSGLTFNAGVLLAGQLDFFMVHLAVKLEIVPNKGFAAEARLVDPIVLIPNYLELTGNEDRSRGPYFSMSTYPVQVTDPKTHQTETKPAHFYLDGRAVLLGLEVATTIDVSSAGLLLDFLMQTGDEQLGANLAVKTTLNSNTGFDFAIRGGVHINDPDFELFNVKLGTLPLTVNVDVDLAFGANTKGAYLRLQETKFEFGDVKFTIPGVDLNVTVQQLKDIPGIIYDAVKNLIWEFLQDVEHWLEWVAQGVIKFVGDIAEVLEDVYNAIASVWGNEKRIVVAVSESFHNSQSTNIILVPDQPGNGITQEMLDAARAWAEQTAEFLATQAIIEQVKQVSPDDVGNFEVSSVQSFSNTYELNQNVNWFIEPHGGLPTLTSLGFQNPTKDQRFFAQTTTQRKFQTAISLDADFAQVNRVALQVRYNGAVLPKWTYTNAVAHTFSTAWSKDAAENFEVQYEAQFADGSTLTTDWLRQKGPVVVLPLGDKAQRLQLKRAAPKKPAASRKAKA
ncbi:hypothetical protein LJ737_13490 [Hymenobacter sp. 15J16-1T3B]|uniref:hypothetical protein n=1 Tax=Hymenobacter sp. 15J16-1T3B TaxID=2886941 RepID=UPI001D11E8A1|nr:hypothetical protein [Hymenobacter sp. 15J16-1T3B]MCC3158256.1 hypothetical protein [Hymenobacter sp. 15J16-1T3B]